MPAGVAVTRRRALVVLGSAPLAAVARRGDALPPELLGTLPQAQLLGEATLRYLGWQVYDIRLWADGPRALDRPEAARLALELKVWRDGAKDPLTEGLAQLDGYLDGLGLPTGWLVIFDQRSGLPDIAERTTTLPVTTPAGRTVTLVRA